MPTERMPVADNRLIEAWGRVVEAVERHDRQAIEAAQAEAERVKSQVQPIEQQGEG